MIKNIEELNQIQFLKEQMHEKKKINQTFLIELRNYTHFRGKYIAKIFAFWDENKNRFSKQNKIIIITESPLYSYAQFVQVIGEILSPVEQSQMIKHMQNFQTKCRSFIQWDMIDYKELSISQKKLSFFIYATKDLRFYLKAALQQYYLQIQQSQSFKPYQKPQFFQITNQLLQKKLRNRYQQKKIKDPINFSYQNWSKHQQFYEKTFKLFDEKVLHQQVFGNYPLLRVKYFLPIHFLDAKTHNKLKGPIYSNSDKQCMFSHFNGYNASTKKQIEDEQYYCPDCNFIFKDLEQNFLLTFLRDNILNPSKRSILYCPEFNRFKVITQQKEIIYENYSHFKLNLKKLYRKNRQFISINEEIQVQDMTFSINKLKLLIKDPAKGRFCNHYKFTDLRLFYLSKKDNLYQCPICQNWMPDTDIIYLREVEIILEYIRFKTKLEKDALLKSKMYINHVLKKVSLEYDEITIDKKSNKQDVNKTKYIAEQIEQFYATLIDPYVSFPAYTLKIPNPKHQKITNKFLGNYHSDNQNRQISQEDQGSDEQ